MRQGQVYVEEHLAGTLTETPDGYVFAYDKDYLSNTDSLPVSLTLPLQEEEFKNKTLFSFFDGLIPEGWLLSIAERNWKVNRRDRMGLLLFCCRDCIGNADMHMKNFSLISKERGRYQLSPTYDQVSTAIVMPEDTEELALPLQGFKKKLMSFDFIYAMTDSGVDQRAAERIIKRFQRYKNSWFECIDISFIKEEQKIQFKNLIANRLETLLK